MAADRWLHGGFAIPWSSRPWRKAAGFVDRILKGTNPATLAIERATKFALVVDRGTPGRIGLTLPDQLLLPADRVVA